MRAALIRDRHFMASGRYMFSYLGGKEKLNHYRAATIGRPGSVGPPGFWLLCIKSRNLMSRGH